MPVVPAHHYRPTYSEADLASLCCEFHIPIGMQPEIASCLEDAAAIWRWYGGATAGHPTRGASAKALRTVATSASGLKAALAALPMPAADALAAQVVKAESASLKGQHIPTGLPVISILHDDGTSAQAVLDLSELAHLVDALESMAISAEADLPDGRRTKEDHALRMWISNVEMLWTETLGRPFTRDMTAEGEPISDAARFCVSAFGKVSPGTPRHSVLNAMKKHIKTVKARTLAKNTSKIDV